VARSSGVPVTNVEGAASSTIPTFGDTVVWSRARPMKGYLISTEHQEDLKTWEKLSSVEKLIKARKSKRSLKQKKG
jgi:hypothetical protein